MSSVVTPEILSSASKVLLSGARICRQVAEDLSRIAGEMDLLRQALRELATQIRTRKEP